MRGDLLGALEALLFVHGDPLDKETLARVLDINIDDVEHLVQDLTTYLRKTSSALSIQEVAFGYRLVTKPEYDDLIKKLFTRHRHLKLSPAALETLAVIAYHQPITAPEVEKIRGVDVSGVIKTLLRSDFIRIAGRQRAPGRPFLYHTTDDFLVHFGLKSLDDLPHVQFLKESLSKNDSGEDAEGIGIEKDQIE